MPISKFTVTGMTCESCVKTMTEKLSAISDAESADVDLQGKNISITTNRNVILSEVEAILSSLPKYKVLDYNPPANFEETISNKNSSIFKTYKPLIVIFTFIILTSLAYQLSLGSFNSNLFMNHLMAGFFIGFSFFKFLDLKAFTDSFSGYDPVGRKFPNYGYIYPFIELALGLLFIAGKYLIIANAMTIFILTITSFGVYKRLQLKSNFQCACLGTTFNLPLSNVTITENAVMILMGVYGLLH